MRYFIDTEFIENRGSIDLVSIAVVGEDGRELYCEVDGVDWSRASTWVLENVKPHLWAQSRDKTAHNAWVRDGGVGGLLPIPQIASHVREFCDPTVHGEPEFWGYYADYDWVVTCWMFGSMMDLPKGWPMYCNDIKQECDRLGNPALPAQTAFEHHALADARWNAQAWRFLQALSRNDAQGPAEG